MTGWSFVKNTVPVDKNVLLAGSTRRCTNPPPNIAHGGWGAQKHEQAEGIDMDLWFQEGHSN